MNAENAGAFFCPASPKAPTVGALIHAIHGARKGFDSRDAVTEPTWTYSRRPLTDTPAPKFDLQRV
ncbi:hypothetical protein EQU24_08490 [Methylotuvimicrobium buryatense]|uniref:Uncharacterized protein n=1 Tax=Methylotuvimicrobium buryatense TaxID=95641 RepID=A0A4P9ULX5_METBY|nr:hypothetical protein EQU24_08490 [Methylotuvimicrobium buryatense]